MSMPSYFEIRLDVLEAFYSFLIQKGYGLNMSCEDILGYLSYDYEEGYSKMDKIMIDLVIYALEGKLSKSVEVRYKIRNNILKGIKSYDFKLLLELLTSNERYELLSDLFILDFIDAHLKDELLNWSTVNKLT